MFEKPKATGAKPQTARKSKDTGTAVTGTEIAPVVVAEPSLLAAGLTIVGDVQTDRDVHIEGTVEGSVKGRKVTIGEDAIIRGEVSGEDVIVNGTVEGRVRGVKVALSAKAAVSGEVIHKALTVEEGARFEGTVLRRDEPLKADPIPEPQVEDAPHEHHEHHHHG